MKWVALLIPAFVLFGAGVLTGLAMWVEVRVGPFHWERVVPVSEVNEPPSRPDKRVPVKIVDWDWDWLPPYTHVNVSGVVRNTGEVPVTSVDVLLFFRDVQVSRGQLIDNEAIQRASIVGQASAPVSLLRPLLPNGSIHFEVAIPAPPHLLSPDLPEKLWSKNMQKGRGMTTAFPGDAGTMVLLIDADGIR